MSAAWDLLGETGLDLMQVAIESDTIGRKLAEHFVERGEDLDVATRLVCVLINAAALAHASGLGRRPFTRLAEIVWQAVEDSPTPPTGVGPN